MLNHGLSQKEWVEMQIVFNEYPEIEEVLLFGSRALSTYKPASDIDLALNMGRLALVEPLEL